MVKNVTSYSGNGLRDWLVQRTSAIALTLFILFMVIFFLSHPELDYLTWHNLFANVGFKIFSLFVLLSLILHAWIGVWTIFTDYIKPARLRIFLEVIVIVALVIFFIWGFIVLWSV